jgi:hypothetical protein
VLSYLALAGWHVAANHQAFDFLNFGIGMAALLAGGGIGVAVKKATEPDPQ